jgi:hypothetical protein
MIGIGQYYPATRVPLVADKVRYPSLPTAAPCKFEYPIPELAYSWLGKAKKFHAQSSIH